MSNNSSTQPFGQGSVKSASAAQSTQPNPALDGLRFISFFCVFIHHTLQFRYDSVALDAIGSGAMHAFFVLSGFHYFWLGACLHDIPVIRYHAFPDTVLALALTIATAALSWRFIETPFTALICFTSINRLCIRMPTPRNRETIIV